MPRLWVDVDGTLIDAEDRPNYALILAVNKVVNGTDTELVIWSDGGAEYANTWGRRLFPWTSWKSAAKDQRLPQPEDLVIDDVLDFTPVHPVRVMLPADFIEAMLL